ncbi:MAG: tetratricopeptide repeat protein [Limnochordaceae bacterium]|nr:tetratricopeptide repeat protein [Limnochordaceae bacterium]
MVWWKATAHRIGRGVLAGGLGLALVATVELGSSAGAAESLPTGAEVLARMWQASIPQLSQFQLGVNVSLDNQFLAQAVIGWSGGLAGTVSLRLRSLLPAPLGIALRPSGFALYRFGGQQQVVADLLAARPLLAIGERVIPQLVQVGWQAQQATVVGVATVAGRPAYVVDITVNPQKLAEGLTALANQTLDRSVLEQQIGLGKIPDDLWANWTKMRDELVQWLSSPESTSEAPQTTRVWVDTTDYVTLQQEIRWPEVTKAESQTPVAGEQANPPATARQETGKTGDPVEQAMATVMEQVRRSAKNAAPQVEVGPDGHIETVTSQVTYQLTAQELRMILDALASQEPQLARELPVDAGAADVEKLTRFSVPDSMRPVQLTVVTKQKRWGKLYLPTQLAVTVDLPAELASVLSSLATAQGKETSETPATQQSAQPQSHQLVLDMDWKLDQGVDETLFNDPALLSVEKGWEDGLAALSEEDFKAAILGLATVVRNAPSFTVAHELLAQAYWETGEIWSAISELEQVVMLNPDDALAKNNLAYLYVDHDIDPARGLELALEAANTDPTNPMFLDTVGWAYFKKGDLESAEGALAAALEQLDTEQWKDQATDENRADVEYHLATVYARMGQWQKASQHVEEALRLQPQHEGAKELQTEIADHTAAAPAA